MVYHVCMFVPDSAKSLVLQWGHASLTLSSGYPKDTLSHPTTGFGGQLSTLSQRNLSMPAPSMPTGKPCIMLLLICCAPYLCSTNLGPTKPWISSLACLHQRVIPPYSPLQTDSPRLFISYTCLNCYPPWIHPQTKRQRQWADQDFESSLHCVTAWHDISLLTYLPWIGYS